MSRKELENRIKRLKELENEIMKKGPAEPSGKNIQAESPNDTIGDTIESPYGRTGNLNPKTLHFGEELQKSIELAEEAKRASAERKKVEEKLTKDFLEEFNSLKKEQLDNLAETSVNPILTDINEKLAKGLGDLNHSYVTNPEKRSYKCSYLSWKYKEEDDLRGTRTLYFKKIGLLIDDLGFICPLGDSVNLDIRENKDAKGRIWNTYNGVKSSTSKTDVTRSYGSTNIFLDSSWQEKLLGEIKEMILNNDCNHTSREYYHYFDDYDPWRDKEMY